MAIYTFNLIDNVQTGVFGLDNFRVAATCFFAYWAELMLVLSMIWLFAKQMSAGYDYFFFVCKVEHAEKQ